LSVHQASTDYVSCDGQAPE